jgi:hypothetical protein
MELPKYFVIQQNEENPLWKKYIEWLSDEYDSLWRGCDYLYYYGYDGNTKWGGTNSDYDIMRFNNNPTIITLEHWNECVNGYVLPEKWYVCPETEENLEIIKNWTKDHSDYFISYPDNAYDSDKRYHSHSKNIDKEYVKITMEQFKKYVLKEINMKKIIGYKLVKTQYRIACENIVNVNVNWNKDKSFAEIMINNPNEYYIEKLTEAGVLDLWFEPVYEDDKIMLDNSKYEIIIANGATIIDGHVFFNDFWKSAKIVAEHSKADVVLGCGAKDVTSSHRWSVSLETINKVLNKLN